MALANGQGNVACLPLPVSFHSIPVPSQFLGGVGGVKSPKSRFLPPKWHFPTWSEGLSRTCVSRLSSTFILYHVEPLFFLKLKLQEKYPKFLQTQSMTRHDIQQIIAQILANSHSPSDSSKFSSEAIGHFSIPISSWFKQWTALSKIASPNIWGINLKLLT